MAKPPTTPPPPKTKPDYKGYEADKQAIKQSATNSDDYEKKIRDAAKKRGV